MNTMITSPFDYFSQWLPQRPDILLHLETEAQEEQIPIVGPVVGRLLYLLARLKNARSILELGTATGYSTLFLADACRTQNGRVLSLEMNEALAQRARNNIQNAGLDHVVDVICADVLETLPTMEGPVDMIFMDIEKADYVRTLPDCHRLLAPGGLLVVDNTGFKDADPFNRAMHEDARFQSVNLWAFLPAHSPEQDGICIAIKN
jgi:predicted O-methyltransferase YrrM